MSAYENEHTRFWRKVVKGQTANACWLWTGAVDNYGYGVFSLSRSRQLIKAHRYAFTNAKGPPGNLCVLHNCPTGDNPRCVNPEHLFLGTRADNNRDKLLKGRQVAGEKHGQSKLTDEKVRVIRERAAAGQRQKDIAADMGVTRQAVSLVLRGKRWQAVQAHPTSTE